MYLIVPLRKIKNHILFAQFKLFRMLILITNVFRIFGQLMATQVICHYLSTGEMIL
jgi:hypothetical protein